MQNYSIAKKCVICIGFLFWGASLYSNTIDGAASGTIYPYDLRYNSIVVGSDLNQSTSILNELLTNLSGTSRLMTYTASSKLYLRNTTLVLDGNYTFSHGSIEVAGEVKITGSGNVFTFAAASLLVDSGSCLTIGPGVTFQFAPTGSWKSNIVFQDNSASLKLIDATLLVNNIQGMVLTGGRLVIDGASTIDSTSTLTTQALFMGTEYTGTGDCVLELLGKSQLNIKNAGIVWRNQNSTSFNVNDGTICVASGGKFLIETSITLNGQSFCYDSSTLTGTAIRSSINSFGSNIATGAATQNFSACIAALSPDNKYLLLTGALNVAMNWTNGYYQYVALPSFACNSVVTTGVYSGGSGTPFTSHAVDWSPDGAYVAVGIKTTGNYYAGTRLILNNFKGLGSIESIAVDNIIGHTGGVAGLKFSPNGKYLALYTIDDVSPTSTSGQLKLFSLDAKNQQLTPISGATQIGLQGADSSTSSWYDLTWSPDGNYIVVATQEGNDSSTLGTTKNLTIWNFTGLTTSLVTSANGGISGSTTSKMSWSPCGRYFAIGGWKLPGNPKLYIYYFDGYTVTQVASYDCGNVGWIWCTSWSPNGKYIAVGTSAGFGLPGGDFSYVMFFQYTSSGLVHLSSLDQTIYGDTSNIYWTNDDQNLGIATSTELVGSTGGYETLRVLPVSYNYINIPYLTLQSAAMKLSQNTTMQSLNLRLG